MKQILVVFFILISFEVKSQFVFGRDTYDTLKTVVNYYNLKICNNPKLSIDKGVSNDSTYSILFRKCGNGFELEIFNYNELALVSKINGNKFSVTLFDTKYCGYINSSTYDIDKLIYDSDDLKYEITRKNQVYKLNVKKYSGKDRNQLNQLTENMNNLISTIGCYVLFNRKRCK